MIRGGQKLREQKWWYHEGWWKLRVRGELLTRGRMNEIVGRMREGTRRRKMVGGTGCGRGMLLEWRPCRIEVVEKRGVMEDSCGKMRGEGEREGGRRRRKRGVGGWRTRDGGDEGRLGGVWW